MRKTCLWGAHPPSPTFQILTDYIVIYISNLNPVCVSAKKLPDVSGDQNDHARHK
ncbi:TPA: hypothetical protein PPG00_003809 [Escherichia coli]|nr:hypothetical protein [Escherichia coli]